MIAGDFCLKENTTLFKRKHHLLELELWTFELYWIYWSCFLIAIVRIALFTVNVAHLNNNKI